MMDNEEIDSILRARLPFFRGVFSFDEWRNIKVQKLPSAFVFNTQPAHVKFGHWVAVCIERDSKAVYFDSFGRKPKTFGFDKFLEKHAVSWRYNGEVIQHPFSAACGQHCIHFLINFHSKDDDAWLAPFSNDLLSNDRYVLKYIEENFNVKKALFL